MKNIKSIQTQFILISVVIILVALGTVGGLISYQIVKNEEKAFLSDSDVQMDIVESLIHNFNEEVDNNINMIADNPLVLSADDTSISNNMLQLTKILFICIWVLKTKDIYSGQKQS